MRFREVGKQEVEPGTTRIKVRFAWFPAFIAGRLIWLERFESLELYADQLYKAKLPDGKDGVFKVCNWVEVSRRLINK